MLATSLIGLISCDVALIGLPDRINGSEVRRIPLERVPMLKQRISLFGDIMQINGKISVFGELMRKKLAGK